MSHAAGTSPGTRTDDLSATNAAPNITRATAAVM